MNKYMSVIPLVFLLCFVVGCQDKAAVAELEQFKAQAAVEEANKALTMRQVEAYQKHDFEALREIYSPNLISHTNQLDLSLEQMLAEMKNTFAMFPDWTLSVEFMFEKGDKVAGRYYWRGTNTGDIEGFPATGKEVKGNGVAIFRFENGKIAEEWFGTDELSVFQQLGMELKPKEAGK